MASNKLSALSAVSGSLTSDSLVYIADTQDSGSSYSSKKITVANLLSDVATTTDLGTFTGTTIDNNQSIKAALQALETALETESSNRATAISNLVDGAPALLDTLNELAAAINDDENSDEEDILHIGSLSECTRRIHKVLLIPTAKRDLRAYRPPMR